MLYSGPLFMHSIRMICICWTQTPNPSFHNLPCLLATTSLFSMSVSVSISYMSSLCNILDFTFKLRHMILVFIWVTSLSVTVFRLIHVAASGVISSFLWLSSIPFCIYTPPYHLNPFICWWTFMLLLYLGYCEKCFCEHKGTCIFSEL